MVLVWRFLIFIRHIAFLIYDAYGLATKCLILARHRSTWHILILDIISGSSVLVTSKILGFHLISLFYFMLMFYRYFILNYHRGVLDFRHFYLLLRKDFRDRRSQLLMVFFRVHAWSLNYSRTSSLFIFSVPFLSHFLFLYPIILR